MRALQFLIWLRDNVSIPCSTEGKNIIPSNSELRRWLQKQSVIVNGDRIGIDDEVKFPITSLVFHPNGKRKCTFW